MSLYGSSPCRPTMRKIIPVLLSFALILFSAAPVSAQTAFDTYSVTAPSDLEVSFTYTDHQGMLIDVAEPVTLTSFQYVIPCAYSNCNQVNFWTLKIDGNVVSTFGKEADGSEIIDFQLSSPFTFAPGNVYDMTVETSSNARHWRSKTSASGTTGYTFSNSFHIYRGSYSRNRLYGTFNFGGSSTGSNTGSDYEGTAEGSFTSDGAGGGVLSIGFGQLLVGFFNLLVGNNANIQNELDNLKQQWTDSDFGSFVSSFTALPLTLINKIENDSNNDWITVKSTSRLASNSYLQLDGFDANGSPQYKWVADFCFRDCAGYAPFGAESGNALFTNSLPQYDWILEAYQNWIRIGVWLALIGLIYNALPWTLSYSPPEPEETNPADLPPPDADAVPTEGPPPKGTDEYREYAYKKQKTEQDKWDKDLAKDGIGYMARQNERDAKFAKKGKS